MLKKTPLASAIHTITVASALAAAGAASQVAVAEEDALEEVVVTGSRIKTSVSDAPRPVSIINRLDIELSGMESVADVLRSSAYNSFGSFRERSGSSFGQIALVDLRGIGADRTAILVNGRRIPGNPLTGTAAVDLNSVPLSAIERVEVLTDSASAIYGADAIGGVINIIFREDFEGAEFEIGGDRPEEEGAESDHFNFTFGAVGDKSSVTFSGEWFKRMPVFDGDRHYSRVNITPNPNGGDPRHSLDTTGVSSGGNTGFEQDFSDAFLVSPTCDTSLYVPLSDPEGIPGAVGCGFGYADVSMQTGGIDRQSTFLNAKYEVADGHEIYFENRYTRVESFGRYAPAVGFFGVGAENDLNPRGHTMLGDVDGNGTLDDGRDIFLFHRFVGHGNRDDSHTRQEFDNVVGFEGAFEDIGINYDVYIRHYEYLTQAEGDTYVIRSIIEDLVADGSYDFSNPLSQDGDHLAAVGQSSATLFRDIKTKYTSFGIALDGSVFDLPAGKVGWAAGAERAHESYKDQYDNFREAGNVLGSAGNSSKGGRSRWAAFGEVSIPVLDNLEVNLAVRYDDYSDFGEETSPQIAARWQPLDQVILRASWGEGFKAPNLGDIGQELSQSFETVTDTIFCAANGIAEADCGDTQVEEFTGGNRDLQAETTESWNFGLVINPVEDFTFSVDWFSIEIDDSVDTLDLQDVIDFEAAGTLPPGVTVGRGPTGTILRCAGADPLTTGCGIVNVFANLATEDIEGVDIRAQYDWNTNSYGVLMAALEYSQILEYDYQPTATAPVTSRPGETGFPEFRYNVNLRWSYSDWTVNYTYRYIDEHKGVTTGSEYEDYDVMDLGVTWVTPWGGEIAFGARNLTDEDPVYDNVSGWDEEESLPLYDVAGRVPYVSYKHFF